MLDAVDANAILCIVSGYAVAAVEISSELITCFSVIPYKLTKLGGTSTKCSLLKSFFLCNYPLEGLLINFG